MLANIRVLELGRAVAAPWAGQMLGDFGAEVIKVEAVEGGDFTRTMGAAQVRDAQGRPTSDGSTFASLNRNKRSIALDLRQPEAQQIVKRLAAVSDVIIENFKPGDLERRGLHYPAMREVNPRLIYLSISGFGQTGPYKSRAGMDHVAQGMIGLTNMTGTAGGPPVSASMPVIDFFTGMNGLSAVLAALYHRDLHGGPGQHIDLSLFDVSR